MPLSDQKIYYFDHAATTPVDPAVFEAMLPYFSVEFANPSSLYRSARRSKRAIEAARKDVADILGAKSTEIVFTSGGTESDNLAIQGVLSAHPDAEWVTTAIEHDAVLNLVPHMLQFGHPSQIVPVKPTGMVNLEKLESAISDQTVLVSVMIANNEIGTIQPIQDIAKLVKKVRTNRTARSINLPLYFHTDAVQAPSYLSLHVERLGVDLLSLSGSKIYGPKGTGILYIRTGTRLDPLFYGGGQERNHRSGTENVPGIVGFAAALRLAQVQRQTESARLSRLRDQALAELTKAIPNILLNGDGLRRLPNNLSLTIPGANGEDLVLYLDNLGILASTGSACTTGNLDPSHVLLAIGRTPTEANSTLRLTLGRQTTADAVDYLVQSLPQVTARVKELTKS
jgi:cysteine desulfurase